ncbi:hypothetical protein GQ607_016248, partial [Colletotrichum asianum]
RIAPPYSAASQCYIDLGISVVARIHATAISHTLFILTIVSSIINKQHWR